MRQKENLTKTLRQLILHEIELVREYEAAIDSVKDDQGIEFLFVLCHQHKILIQRLIALFPDEAFSFEGPVCQVNAHEMNLANLRTYFLQLEKKGKGALEKLTQDPLISAHFKTETAQCFRELWKEAFPLLDGLDVDGLDSQSTAPVNQDVSMVGNAPLIDHSILVAGQGKGASPDLPRNMKFST